MSVIAYCRTSSKGQNLGYQKKEINDYVINESVSVDKWVEEQISAKRINKGSKLKGVIEGLEEGDILITSEISRLGRDIDTFMDILRTCLSKGCEIWSIRENYKLKNDLASKIILFAYGLTSELEHNLIKQRTKNALNVVKESGKKLGRPYGANSKKLKLDDDVDKIRKLLQEKKSKSYISRELGVDRSTLCRYIDKNKLTGDN